MDVCGEIWNLISHTAHSNEVRVQCLFYCYASINGFKHYVFMYLMIRYFQWGVNENENFNFVFDGSFVSLSTDQGL
jgi:hypothetical protein